MRSEFPDAPAHLAEGLFVDGVDGSVRQGAGVEQEVVASLPSGGEHGQHVVGRHVGLGLGQEIQRLYERDAYRDYLILHGFSVEMTEALAECIHDRIRRELGIEPTGTGDGHAPVPRAYPGRRYSFGYAACPDLSQQETVVRLLAAEQIGVRLSEGYQMIPEQSVSALIVHHPQAQYFSV